MEVEPTAVPVVDDGGHRIEGRSLGQLAWARLRKDKVAIGGGVVIVLLMLVAIAGWPLEHFGVI
ncbi:MAG: hypothetical protein L0Y54_14535, partial [Sporichthyaceae bacterium]|nr:hypothetical protein [Sporichthyaceae bacterium]